MSSIQSHANCFRWRTSLSAEKHPFFYNIARPSFCSPVLNKNVTSRVQRSPMSGSYVMPLRRICVSFQSPDCQPKVLLPHNKEGKKKVCKTLRLSLITRLLSFCGFGLIVLQTSVVCRDFRACSVHHVFTFSSRSWLDEICFCWRSYSEGFIRSYVLVSITCKYLITCSWLIVGKCLLKSAGSTYICSTPSLECVFYWGISAGTICFVILLFVYGGKSFDSLCVYWLRT